MKQPVIHSAPDILGGVPVLVGTRVPVKDLFGHLEAGDSLHDIQNSFASMTRDQVVAALEFAREGLAQDAHPV
jgi:uncharacterized protein (DUF433 family)